MEMEQEFREAFVYVRDTYAGMLRETDEGYEFVYDTDYLQNEKAAAVSLTMPKQAEKYFSKTLFAFFDGLIPEGWLLALISDHWKIDPNDRFGLLLASCRDCIGAVSIRRAKA